MLIEVIKHEDCKNNRNSGLPGPLRVSLRSEHAGRRSADLIGRVSHEVFSYWLKMSPLPVKPCVVDFYFITVVFNARIDLD